MEKLKKKLFVAGAYLTVSAALLILVSFGQYRIKIKGEINMPEASQIQASIDLDHALTETVGMSAYLTDLQPGDNARTYASEYSTNSDTMQVALNHRMRVVIYNSYTPTAEELEADSTMEAMTSDLGVKYSLRITGTGRIPMQFVMTYDGKSYISKREEDEVEYRFYEISGSGENEQISETEASFIVTTGNTSGNAHQIFAGWDNTAEDAAALTAIEYCREVELLELRAEVTSDTTHYTLPSEAVIQERLEDQLADSEPELPEEPEPTPEEP